METGGDMSQRSKSAGDPYTVTLIDADGCTIYSDEVDTLSQARTRAREYITDPEATDAHKAEVRDSANECVFDIFANQVIA
jgi:hypothetical protein